MPFVLFESTRRDEGKHWLSDNARERRTAGIAVREKSLADKAPSP